MDGRYSLRLWIVTVFKSSVVIRLTVIDANREIITIKFSGQPENISNHNCVILKGTNSYQWMSDICTDADANPICSYTICGTTTTSTTTKKPNNHFKYFHNFNKHKETDNNYKLDDNINKYNNSNNDNKHNKYDKTHNHF